MVDNAYKSLSANDGNALGAKKARFFIAKLAISDEIHNK